MDSSALLITLFLPGPWMPHRTWRSASSSSRLPESSERARLVSLEGHRVRLAGFMVRSEDPPTGGFYLCPLPVVATEAGRRTGDLPPETVFVVVRSSRGRTIPYVPRPLEVTGILELGNLVDEDGQVSSIRVVLEGPFPDRAGAGQPTTPQR